MVFTSVKASTYPTPDKLFLRWLSATLSLERTENENRVKLFVTFSPHDLFCLLIEFFCADNRETYKLCFFFNHKRFQFLLREMDNRAALCSFSLCPCSTCDFNRPCGLKTWVFSDRSLPKSMTCHISLEKHTVALKTTAKTFERTCSH